MIIWQTAPLREKYQIPFSVLNIVAQIRIGLRVEQVQLRWFQFQTHGRHLWMKFKSYQPGIRHKSSWQTSSHISEKIWLSSFFIVSAVTSWIIITCSSKGKNSTLMKQEDLKMAELNQVTFPSLYFLQSSIKRRKGYDDVINDFAPRLLLHWCWSHRRCIAWNATCQTHFRNAKVTINPQNQVSVSFRKS